MALDSLKLVEYAVGMAEPLKTDLESQVRLWIKKRTKENSRLEFKLKIDLGMPGAKAEFIRDVISLANSEGEHPRSPGHLVIGFREGERRDVAQDHYEGAAFTQFLDSYVSPPVRIQYEEFDCPPGRIGVIVVHPEDAVYLVAKEFRDAKNTLLFPGQAWGRRADGKRMLNGEALQQRFSDIRVRQIDNASGPLKNRISKLEREGGPSLEVKRIRFEIQAATEWSAYEPLLEKLEPYAREFDNSVKDEVLNAVSWVTARTRIGMPVAMPGR